MNNEEQLTAISDSRNKWAAIKSKFIIYIIILLCLLSYKHTHVSTVTFPD